MSEDEKTVKDKWLMMLITLIVFGSIVAACCVYIYISPLPLTERMCLKHEGTDVIISDADGTLLRVICNDRTKVKPRVKNEL